MSYVQKCKNITSLELLSVRTEKARKKAAFCDLNFPFLVCFNDFL
jgi:hypothetical protein